MRDIETDPITTNPTTAVNPSAISLTALAAVDDVGPIAMLNLLSFDGDSGRAAYGRYAQVAAISVAAAGGSLIYLGRAIESDVWDSVALVYYPSRTAYLDMQRDQSYVDAVPDRTAGLRARLLYPFELPQISGSKAAAQALASGEEVTAFQLRRSNKPTTPSPSDDSVSATATTVLQLPAGGPGLVTDGRWDELRVLRYASLQASLDDVGLRTAMDSDVADLMVVVTQQTELP